MPADESLTAAQWREISTRRILFGHQSVGRNLLDGVRALAVEAGVSAPIVESRAPTATGGITHFKVGNNGDPLGKIRDFAAVVDGGTGDAPDIALMKLCYIDFSPSIDPHLLATAYCDTLEGLQRRFPDTVFAAVTAPLTTVQTGPKALVKRLLRRAPDGWAENARRESFNAVLRERYGDSRRLFDLAAIEAAGSGVGFRSGGVPSLDPALTSDGGHLNDRGARLVAAQFLRFLAGAKNPPENP